ncbi:subunit P of phosphatidylinositol N-acetylglucosaminyltransferase [Purpureocillium lilacinum]|uniref:Subunit P of phosphatidylinositol N-acetylglucosaminyltransferase n=1 Tax=Purpureocillium lilacinum TaxID=33203 RepID=A0A179HWR0_PURLI|nr:subunit P of phosphatidylinositol N-acetylglucosaminyltransferase [Purpureocillium lilacinum]OAQ93918.1 subunit P of phosphatidylinositol N-acetylglucosaminyltransferase [Purpureocillium lilacinum]
MKFLASLLFAGIALAAAVPGPAEDMVEKRCHAKDQYCAANSICCSGVCIGANNRFGGYCKTLCFPFAPPFYGPTPLPPSPSLTSLLRPSRPTTPDASDDENVAPLPRAAPKVPTYEYYGFVLYLFSSLTFLLWLPWSYTPAPFLLALGIRYYPDRWWALATPAFLVMTLVYIYVALASYNTEMLTADDRKDSYYQRFADWNKAGRGFQKNKLDHDATMLPDASVRALQTRRSKKTKDMWFYGESLYKRFANNVALNTDYRTLDTYREQEIVLKSIHGHVFSLFETFSWSSDSYFIISPSGASDPSETWQELADLAFGTSVLVRNGQTPHAKSNLQRIDDLLEQTATTPDPFFAAKFWRFSKYFYDICENEQNFNLLYTMFNHYKCLIENRCSKEHPLVSMLNALCQVEIKDLRDTLRIGYLMSIRALKSCIHGDHPVTLSMWSNYFKEWDSNGSFQSQLAESYRRLLQQADQDPKFKDQPDFAIPLLHRYTYFVYYVLQDDTLSLQLGKDLLDRSRCSMVFQRTRRWAPESQAFAFASKVLGLVSRKLGNQAAFEYYYNAAIAMFCTGDDECRTRALMLRSELAEALDTWNGSNTAD